MNEKDKKKSTEKSVEKTGTKADAKDKTEKPVEPKPDKPEAKRDKSPDSVAVMKPRRRRDSFLSRGRSKDAAFPVDILARRTDTDPVVLGALKAAYGWTDQTTLTQTEFLNLRDAWLKRPVKEG